MFKFDLGQLVRDKITGFNGIVVARTEYLTGCSRYSVQSRKLDEKGKPQDWLAFDEDQLELKTKEPIKIGPQKIPGGPKPSVQLSKGIQK